MSVHGSLAKDKQQPPWSDHVGYRTMIHADALEATVWRFVLDESTGHTELEVVRFRQASSDTGFPSGVDLLTAAIGTPRTSSSAWLIALPDHANELELSEEPCPK